MLRTTLAVLPIVTAGLYLLGLTYYQGYLGGFGIEETLFPLSIDRILFEGFIAFVTLSAKPFAYLLLAAMGVGIATLIAAGLSTRTRIRSWASPIARKFYSVFPEASSKETTMLRIVAKLAVTMDYVIRGVLIYVVLLMVGLASTKSGEEQAFRFITEATASKINYVTLYSPNGVPLLTGKPIVCSASHCAYWLGTEAIILRNETVEKAITHKHSLPSK